MKGAMPLDKTLPLWDITAMPNFQMKYPLSRKRKVSQMRRTSLKAPLQGVARKRAHAAYGGVWGTAGAGLFQAQGGERESKRFLCVIFL